MGKTELRLEFVLKGSLYSTLFRLCDPRLGHGHLPFPPRVGLEGDTEDAVDEVVENGELDLSRKIAP